MSAHAPLLGDEEFVDSEFVFNVFGSTTTRDSGSSQNIKTTSRTSFQLRDEELNGFKGNVLEVVDNDLSKKLVSTPIVQHVEPKLTTPSSYWTTWTEDGVGLLIAVILFCMIAGISHTGYDILKDYQTGSSWPLGGTILGLGMVITAHTILHKPMIIESYCCILLIAVAARSIGNYKVMTDSGLGASLWAILIGICIRSSGIVLNKGAFSGEFFVKVGVTLMAMDFSSVVSIGVPGLLVSWLDTILILGIGTWFCSYIMSFSLQDSIVVAGATSICGSSAATALSSSIHPKGYKDETAKTIIAIMGVLNAPLMPLLPLGKTAFHMNPSVIGAWIGGSIDSTGQVTASAEIGGKQVLRAAVVIKMAQNILIGPLCLFFTTYFHKAFSPSILVEKFPLFVIGFLSTSLVVSCVLSSEDASDNVKEYLVSNSWGVSEFITLIGFATIGLEIDVRVFFTASSSYRSILSAYLFIQGLDLLTTFGWSYLAFHDRQLHDDDYVDSESNNPTW